MVYTVDPAVNIKKVNVPGAQKMRKQYGVKFVSVASEMILNPVQIAMNTAM